jgi:oxygen-independent coproporphyrinogen-3 oxidase
MGLQLTNPRLLEAYGRGINRVGYNRRAVDNIREAGFRRLNIDLMYGLAQQPLADFRRTLEQTIALGPEYITLYRMRYKGTRVRAEADRVDLDQVMRAYELARELLLAAGYRAQPGKNGFSRVPGDPGTSEYLTERVVHSTPYLGLGLGAQTFTNNILAYNLGAAEKRLKRYLAAVGQGRLPIQDLYLLPPSEGMAKMISVSFYFGQIHLGAFCQNFGVELEQAFPDELDFVRRRGLMQTHGQALCLTSRGARVFNGVVALFYSPRVKDHLVKLYRSRREGT